MRLNPKLPLLTVLMALALSVTGCMSFNAQTLDLHPEVQVNRQLSKEKRIDVQPLDLRNSPVIGLRSTSKQPHPEIRLKDSLKLLKHTTEHALEDMGIRRFYGGEFTMKVSLLDLSYTAKKAALKQTVDLAMLLRIEVSKGDKSYTGTYRSDKQHTFVGIPSEKENEEIIGKLVSETLSLGMNDNQLIDFLQFN